MIDLLVLFRQNIIYLQCTSIGTINVLFENEPSISIQILIIFMIIIQPLIEGLHKFFDLVEKEKVGTFLAAKGNAGAEISDLTRVGSLILVDFSDRNSPVDAAIQRK